MDDKTKAIQVSAEKFQEIKASLKQQLHDGLEEELAMNEFDNPPKGDLWNVPTVDSKTVIKLSPIVEKMTGQKIKPQWIKPGGYNNAEEAVTHLLSQIEASCDDSSQEGNNG